MQLAMEVSLAPSTVVASTGGAYKRIDRSQRIENRTIYQIRWIVNELVECLVLIEIRADETLEMHVIISGRSSVPVLLLSTDVSLGRFLRR